MKNIVKKMLGIFNKLTNTFKKRIGLACAIFCLFVPLLSRMPRGMDWVMQYFPMLPVSNMDIGSIIGALLFAVIPGNLFLLAFASIPPVIVFVCALKSKTRFYLPLVLSFIATVIASAYFHHDYDFDLYTYNLAGLAFILFPMQISFFAGLAGGIGIILEEVFLWITGREK